MGIVFSIAFLVIITLVVFRPGKLPEGGIAVCGLLVLVALSLLHWGDIPTALAGSELMRPLEIVAILISLAVLSMTLDELGFFQYASHRAILWSQNSGVALFRNFFILTVLLTTFTSNDVDVLTMTPIILWFVLETRVDPIPYLVAVFVAANTSSMELLIGNLTNIVVGDTFEIGFVRFFVVMIIPTIVTLIAQYAFLRCVFRKRLRGNLLPSEALAELRQEVRKPLRNKKQNVFVLSVLACVIIGSAIADVLAFDLWVVTAIGAVVVLVFSKTSLLQRIRSLPWNVVVFVLVFIVLTGKLDELGVIRYIASHCAVAFDTFWGAIFTSTMMSAAASGVMNNIPASISVSAVLSQITAQAPTLLREATAFGTIIGTNLGALITPVGALATILWMTLIRANGIRMPMRTFIAYSASAGLISLVVAATTLGITLLFIV
ncbi:MAG: SLC13 family permease [Candidatus Uhrbacteria bacterium]